MAHKIGDTVGWIDSDVGGVCLAVLKGINGQAGVVLFRGVLQTFPLEDLMTHDEAIAEAMKPRGPSLR